MKTISLPVFAFLLVHPLHAFFIVNIDDDGQDNGLLALNPNFAFGGDTTIASSSASTLGPLGMPDGDSIFGGNGVSLPDTYTFSYTPGVDIDNFATAAGVALNADGDLTTGIAGGGTGTYNIYAAWPFTNNVSGGDTTFSIAHEDGLLSVALDQNNKGGEWVFIGTAFLETGSTYTLSMSSTSNTFVSMRASGVMFEAAVPEPSLSAAFLGIAVAGLAILRRRHLHQ